MWDFPKDLPAGGHSGLQTSPWAAQQEAPQRRPPHLLRAAHLLSRKAVSLRLGASRVEAGLRASTASGTKRMRDLR